MPLNDADPRWGLPAAEGSHSLENPAGFGLDDRASRSASANDQGVDATRALQTLRCAPLGETAADDFRPVFAQLLHAHPELPGKRTQNLLGSNAGRGGRPDGRTAAARLNVGVRSSFHS